MENYEVMRNAATAGQQGYISSGELGADYGLFGRINNFFSGKNDYAERVADRINADYQNKFNADEAAKNRQFEEYMSSTAYQRMMADAKKAGINPYYLVQNSSGSSSPAGSAASSSYNFGSSRNPKKGSNALGNLATTAIAIAKIAAILSA